MAAQPADYRGQRRVVPDLTARLEHEEGQHRYRAALASRLDVREARGFKIGNGLVTHDGRLPAPSPEKSPDLQRLRLWPETWPGAVNVRRGSSNVFAKCLILLVSASGIEPETY